MFMLFSYVDEGEIVIIDKKKLWMVLCELTELTDHVLIG